MNLKGAIRNIAAAGAFMALFVGIPFAVFHGVRAADSTPPLSAKSGTLLVDSPLENRVQALLLPSPVDGLLCFSLENRSDDRLTLSLNNLYFPHRVSINDQAVAQNIDPESSKFDAAMRSKDFGIPPHSGKQMVCIEGAGVQAIRAYLAPKATMHWQHRMAEEINSFLILVVIALGALDLIVSAVHHSLNKLNIAVLLTFVFCILKVALQQTSPILSALAPVSPEQFQVWFVVSTMGFSFSLFLVYAFFFDVQPRRWFFIALGGYAAVMLSNFFLTVFGGANNALLPLILLCRILLFVWILGFAVFARKPYAKCIFFTHAISDGLVACYSYLTQNPAEAGLLPFYVDIAFLGFSIQFIVALGLFVSQTLLHSRDYRRLLMLRGLEHDLKIPLSVIKLNHQMIRRYSLRDDDDKAIRFSGAIDRALSDLDGMIQNLRYQLENRPAEQTAGTDLADLFRALQEDFQAVCTSRGAKLTVDAPEPGVRVAMNPDALKRVLYNLLDNAFKYGGNNLRVTLSAVVSSKKNRISVSDNGPGLMRSQRQKATHLFYKADPSRGTAGLGLGLHVVRTLVRQNRGSLDIRSTKGSGTTVTITLPSA